MIPKKSVQNMKPYSGPGEGRMDGWLRLDFNENLLGASPKVMEAIRNITAEACGCYPEYGDLYQELSDYFAVGRECIVATNGSDEAIKMVFDTYVEKGDDVILLTPSYAMYELYAQVAGANMIEVAYREGDFSFPLEEILRMIRPTTRLIALANPNNPTGTLIAREELLQIIEANPRMVVLIDEAYAPFARTSNIDLAGKYPNVFVTQTFSKAHGLAGLRFGVLMGTKTNIAQVAKILCPSYSVDCLAVAAASAAMKDQAYVDAYVNEVIAARDSFSEEVASLGLDVIPSFGNFLLIFFGKRAGEIKEALRQKRILVRQRADLEGYLRISIGTKAHMQQVLDVLKPLYQPALIFDMDGVLVDETQSYRNCIVKTAEYFLGEQVAQEHVERLKKKGGYNNDYDCTEAILYEKGRITSREEIIERFDLYYADLKHQEKWLLPDQILFKLKDRYRLGIFTGRPRKDALDALKRFGKEVFFEVVITDDDVQKRKPDPEGLVMAMKKLQATRAIYFGDSKDDQEAAKRAAVEFVEVFPGQDIGRLICEKEWVK